MTLNDEQVQYIIDQLEAGVSAESLAAENPELAEEVMAMADTYAFMQAQSLVVTPHPAGLKAALDGATIGGTQTTVDEPPAGGWGTWFTGWKLWAPATLSLCLVAVVGINFWNDSQKVLISDVKQAVSGRSELEQQRVEETSPLLAIEEDSLDQAVEVLEASLEPDVIELVELSEVKADGSEDSATGVEVFDVPETLDEVAALEAEFAANFPEIENVGANLGDVPVEEISDADPTATFAELPVQSIAPPEAIVADERVIPALEETLPASDGEIQRVIPALDEGAADTSFIARKRVTSVDELVNDPVQDLADPNILAQQLDTDFEAEMAEFYELQQDFIPFYQETLFGLEEAGALFKRLKKGLLGMGFPNVYAQS